MISIAEAVPRRVHGGVFVLRSVMSLPAPRDDVFRFFADARNLDRITPPFLKFRVLTAGNIDMRVGTRINYGLRVHGIPLRWTSEITVWEPPERFVDVQVRGPYRRWHHTHRFEDLGSTTRVIDEVEYAVPGGRLMHALFVRRDLLRIFNFRSVVLAQLFPHAKPDTSDTVSAVIK
jgi:ligand-binding SRPBCC domain-containing protein